MKCLFKFLSKSLSGAYPKFPSKWLELCLQKLLFAVMCYNLAVALVQIAVLNGFCHMGELYFGRAFQIGDGAGQL